ncbi:hypothetical protein M011DRAFT_396913, partial [Sporormia fimetaria CBS 119925]
ISKIPAEYVKRGMWVDVASGQAMGRVITTDMRTSNLIVAVLAVATAIATTHLFNLIIFGYHQLRVNASPTDGLHRQQQIILRTLPTPSSLVSEWAKVWWAWRGRARSVHLRSLPQVSIAALFTVASIAFGLLTSYVVSDSAIDVLASSPLCGQLTVGPVIAPGSESEGKRISMRNTVWALDVIGLSQRYAEECYKIFSSAVPDICSVYTRPNIELKTERGSCPFDESICVKIDSPGVTVDSGLVDLNDGFGLNLGTDDRVKYRKRTTCAVLHTTDRYTILKEGDETPPYVGKLNPGEQILLMHMGKIDERMGNTTLSQSLLVSKYTLGYMTAPLYKSGSPSGGLSGYPEMLEPLPEMATKDADLFLIWITKNVVQYGSPVDDPIFAAHKEVATPRGPNQGRKTFRSDFPNAAVGCKAQQDFCTPLQWFPTNVSELNYAEATEMQKAAATLLISSGWTFDLITGSNTLRLDKQAKIGEIIAQVPPDQWVTEVRAWESNIWASLQIAVTDQAIGIKARNNASDPIVREDASPAEKHLCGMQRMRNPGGFVNVNVFGLAFILTFCCVVTLIDLFLVRFIVYINKVTKRKPSPRIEAWIRDGIFQLQGRVYEGRGEGPWEKLSEEVPVTVEGTELSALKDGSEEDFAILRTRLTGLTMMSSGGDHSVGDNIGKVMVDVEEREATAPQTPRTSTPAVPSALQHAITLPPSNSPDDIQNSRVPTDATASQGEPLETRQSFDPPSDTERQTS